MTTVAICRIVNGKLVMGWVINDGLDMFKQVGAIECTEQGKKLFSRRCWITALANISAIHMPIK